MREIDPSRRSWFGPRRYGWGWTPRTWEGWVTLLPVILWAVLAAPLADSSPALWVAGIVVTLGVLLAACWVKGTPPGGPTAWHHFRDLQHPQGRQPKASPLRPDEVLDHLRHRDGG